jgi:iron(III) transport system ATP-binding protein
MNQGRIEQVGTPREIYETPATPFAADFVGKVNVLPAVIEGGTTCRVGGMALSIARGDLAAGTAVKLYLRPEDIALSVNGAGAANTLPARVAKIEFLGAFCMVAVALDLPGTPGLTVNLPRQAVADARLAPGSPVSVSMPPAALRILG